MRPEDQYHFLCLQHHIIDKPRGVTNHPLKEYSKDSKLFVICIPCVLCLIAFDERVLGTQKP